MDPQTTLDDNAAQRLAEWLRKRLLDWGINADLLARHSGVGRPMLSRLLAGDAGHYSSIDLAAIARVLGLTSDSLAIISAGGEPVPDSMAAQQRGVPMGFQVSVSNPMADQRTLSQVLRALLQVGLGVAINGHDAYVQEIRKDGVIVRPYDDSGQLLDAELLVWEHLRTVHVYGH